MVTMLKCDLISVLTIWMVCKYVGSTAIHYGVGSSINDVHKDGRNANNCGRGKGGKGHKLALLVSLFEYVF